MTDIPEVSAEAREVAHVAAAPDCRAALENGFHPGKVPGLEVSDDRIRADAKDTRRAFERYVANPVYRQIVDTRAEEIDGHPADALWMEDVVAVENEFLHVGSPPIRLDGDWEKARDGTFDRLPELSGEEAAEWRFIYLDGRHPTVWRLVHIPTGWRSPSSSRWRREGGGEYVCGSAFDYRIEFTPEGSEAARVIPESKSAVKVMAGISNVGYDADGNTVTRKDWYLHPEAEPTEAELREAYLCGDLTEWEFEEALDNAVDLDVETGWEDEEDEELAALDVDPV